MHMDSRSVQKGEEMSSRNLASSALSTPKAPSKHSLELQSLENRKTRYTKQVLREAFIELLRKKPLEKITVTRICEIADVSRGTFYLHYRNPYDLLESMENEFLADLEKQLRALTATAKDDYSEDADFWLDILNMLLAEKELMQLFFANPNGSFLTKCLALNRVYSEELCKHMFPNMSQQERDYMHTFYEHGSASVMSLWVRNGFIEPPARIAALLTALNLKSCDKLEGE